MGANSSIEWTHHTFNPWWGCLKVSEACKNCYAEAWAKRVGSEVWGKSAPRRFFGEKHWSEPFRWNKNAASEGTRMRVFCASMADVFEDRSDLCEPRRHLWHVINSTPHLDWLLLTKRPENVASMVLWTEDWPENVWLGTTAETQANADKRIPYILDTGARVKFISAEPLLGPLDIRRYLDRGLGWVITGGESGPRSRPSSPSWFTGLQRQCFGSDVPFHFKQWGDWKPIVDGIVSDERRARAADDGTVMFRYGKRAAGRELYGREWSEVPKVIAA